MNTTAPKIAVIGLSSIGAMAFWQLAKRGANVTGFESHTPGHDRSAGGGGTRMFRLAYYEGSEYAELLTRSLELWRELERDAGWQILAPTGGLTIGAPDLDIITGAARNADAAGFPYEILDAAATHARWPIHTLAENEVCLYDPLAGTIKADLAMISSVTQGIAHGGTVRTNTPVTEITEDESGVWIHTESGSERFDRVIVAAGHGTRKLLPNLPGMSDSHVITHAWYAPRDRRLLDLGKFPIVLRRSGPDAQYGAMPALDGHTMKLSAHGFHELATVNDPSSVEKGELQDLDLNNDIVQRLLPDFVPYPVAASTYVETSSLDNHALAGFIPGSDRTIVLSAFSGHGFKMATGFGQLGADLALHGTSELEIDVIRPDRDFSEAGIAARKLSSIIEDHTTAKENAHA